MTAHRAHAVDVDRLDLLADDLTFEIASTTSTSGSSGIPHPDTVPSVGGGAARLALQPLPRDHVRRPARPPSSNVPRRRRTPRRGGTRRRRTASSGRGPRGAPGSGAAGRTAGPRAPGAASCSPGRPGPMACSRMRLSSTASTSRVAGSSPPSRYTAAMTASIASARIDGLARPPDASSPLPRRSDAPRSSSCAISASASALTTAARSLASSPSGSCGYSLVDEVGDDETEHRVAEELEPLVRLLDAVLGAVRAVGQRAVEEGVVDEVQPSASCSRASSAGSTAPPPRAGI